MRLYRIIPVVLLIAVVGVAVAFPSDRNSDSLDKILTVSTFLFGIFIGFSISDRHTRIDEIRNNDSLERGKLLFLYYSSKLYGKKTEKRIKTLIDNYLMSSLDFRVWDYYRTEKEYAALIGGVASINPKTDKEKDIYDNLFYSLEDVEVSRKKTIGVIGDRLSKFEWVIFVFLSVVIIMSLLLMNKGTIISIVMASSLSISIIMVLALLYSLDNLSWKEETRIFEPYQKTFEALGLLRYYPEAVIYQKRVKLHRGKAYRMGVFPRPYPDLSGKKIKIVRAKSS